MAIYLGNQKIYPSGYGDSPNLIFPSSSYCCHRVNRGYESGSNFVYYFDFYTNNPNYTAAIFYLSPNTCYKVKTAGSLGSTNNITALLATSSPYSITQSTQFINGERISVVYTEDEFEIETGDSYASLLANMSVNDNYITKIS